MSAVAKKLDQELATFGNVFGDKNAHRSNGPPQKPSNATGTLTESSCDAVAATILWAGAFERLPQGGSLAIEEGAKARVACAAYRKLRTRAQHGDIAVFAIGFDLGNTLKIHEIGAMNTQEPRWVKRCFQA